MSTAIERRLMRLLWLSVAAALATIHLEPAEDPRSYEDVGLDRDRPARVLPPSGRSGLDVVSLDRPLRGASSDQTAPDPFTGRIGSVHSALGRKGLHQL